MSPRRRSSSNAIVIILGLLALCGLVYTTSGEDPIGMFGGSDAPVAPATQQFVPPTATPVILPSDPLANIWWEVYFTDPLTVNDPANYTNSIEDLLIWHINNSRTSIHIAAFEFNLTPVAEALIAAHNRGVDVRWITDDENGLDVDLDPGRGQFAMLQGAGIPVVADNRSALMHDKFWVFDGQTVWTGSTNITANGIFEQNNNVIVIHVPEVAAMYERQWQDMWAGNFGPDAPSTIAGQGLLIEGRPFLVMFSPEDHVVDQLISLVNNAQNSIRFLAFSFTDYPLANAMIQRAQAGVDVAGVYETVGSQTEYSELGTFLCSGVPVRQDGNPGFMHEKVIIIDGHLVITGSLNYSSSADEENNENVVIVDNPDIAALYLQEFARVWLLGSAPN
jgi:phosphatidylserine/phosphatidylglycerophosphate/cardiolipin synthase-like enzyme